MAKIYRTAKGRSVDIEALRRANEDKVAAGNMKVNARGDELGTGGAVVRNIAERARAAKKNPTQTVRNASLKPKVSEPKKEEGTIKTREDGSTYREIFDEEGNITTEELNAPTKKKTTKKKVAKNETESTEEQGISDEDGEG